VHTRPALDLSEEVFAETETEPELETETAPEAEAENAAGEPDLTETEPELSSESGGEPVEASTRSESAQSDE
jgi:hypothetical protein